MLSQFAFIVTIKIKRAHLPFYPFVQHEISVPIEALHYYWLFILENEFRLRQKHDMATKGE